MKNRLQLSTFAFCFLAMTSCRLSPSKDNAKGVTQHSTYDIIDLATPIYIDGKTTVLLDDYFISTSRIDSVVVAANYSSELSSDKKTLMLEAKEGAAPLSEMKTYIGGNPYSLLLRRVQKKTVPFKLKDQKYKQVQMKGEMNAWNPTTANFVKNNLGEWEFSFQLKPGNYQYLYVVDGKEMKDPNNATTAPNGIGGFNNLLSLQKPQPNKLSNLYTYSHQGSEVVIGFDNKPNEVFAFWQNYRLSVQMENGTCKVQIPSAASNMKRSFLRIWAYNEEGISNDLLIPLENGEVMNNPSQVMRQDKEAQIMYFILLDRFVNGKASNDQPVKDARVLPRINYHGGDLVGISQKIKDGYLKSMNINSLWLSPITQNPTIAYREFPEPRRWHTGYHGYWPIYTTKIDHRFGTDQEMHDMVNAAHDANINVLLDYVCHHVHQDQILVKQHPDWITPLTLADGRKNIRIWEEQRLTTWFDDFLPTFDFSKTEVIKAQADSAAFWLKNYNLDGYRHDATKHIHTEFWRYLTRKIKDEVIVPNKKPVYQIGETYGSRELIQSYIGSGLLDSQFDFPMHFDAREVFAKDDSPFSIIANTMAESFDYFGYHSTMGYISGNHDQPRFISLASGALDFAEDSREAGFKRDIQVKDSIGYNRMQMMHAFNMSIPGVPVIYYGDEIGMAGANDPDNRRMMRFENLNPREKQTKQAVEKLTTLRKNRLSLIYGDTKIVHLDKETFAFIRTYFDEISIAVFNKSREAKTFAFEIPSRYAGETLNPQFGNSIVKDKQSVQVTIAPASFDILTD